MGRIHGDITTAMGATPLVRLARIGADLPAEILAKIEFYNPSGSIKDRSGVAILDAAAASGTLKPGGTVVEATSGNSGIALAAAGAARGYRVILTMPDTMSVERRQLLRAYGADIVLTDGSLGMHEACMRARAIAESMPGAVLADQFRNRANPEIHYRTTGPEIWEATEGGVDIFVAAVGTGGTISGTGRFLKAQNPKIKVIAVEPEEAQLLGCGTPGPHRIEGIGTNFMPETLDRTVFDEVFPVSLADSVEVGRALGTQEGILAGISSGATVFATIQLAQRPENRGKKIVTIVADFGERYFSTVLHEHYGI
ncbi:MAG: cysteine synthase A [Microbacteriaceae bacterium]|nr:cysteine synthase A [Microbacteriaceae bacterium]